jgi:c-di-GMP-related signal transduction protein
VRVVTVVDVVVGRQPIFDRDLRVIGYELLFRTIEGDDRTIASLDGDLMTSEVLFSSQNIGIHRLVGNKLMFCNADRGLLTGRVPLTLPPEQTVVEVLETVTLDDEVLAGCRALVDLGFRLALDDFTWFDGAEQLLELVWMVKIDLRLSTVAEVKALYDRCRPFGVLLLAEKVETAEELALCQQMGFDYFQGYVLERPSLVPGRTLDATSLGRVRLAAHLLSSEVDLDELESIVRTEPGMMLQLLQLASVGSRDGTRGAIGSLRQALVMVGERRLRGWAALLTLVRLGSANVEDFAVALARARMCELLAARTDPSLASFAYTAGLLSAFDRLLGVPIEDVAPMMSLDDELRRAAFDRIGPVGELVREVVRFENPNEAEPSRMDVLDPSMHTASVQALMWAVEACVGWEDGLARRALV